MEHRELRQIFGDDFSRSAFQIVDDELRLIGKYGELTLLDDGSFDIWIVNPDRTPMNTLRLNTIVRKMESLRRETGFKILDGEAWGNTTDKDLAVEYGLLLRIKKRRRVSPEQAKAMAAKIAQYQFKKGK